MTTPFRHRCVQDLAWVIHSPPLISGHIANTDWWTADHFAREYQACLPELLKLDQNPARLKNALNKQKSLRLGHYFEALVACWLEISPRYTLLAQQIQLRTEHKTLGELDFIVQEQSTAKIIHLEVAVKFYLGHANTAAMNNWHGPGLKDRLDLKFNHLRRHQTQLSHHFPEKTGYPIDATACMLKGRLFYPPDCHNTASFSAPKHLRGCWHTHLTDKQAAGNLLQLKKRDWLAPIQNPNQYTRYNPTNHRPEHPQCIAEYADDREQQRLFLLPEGFWPGVKS